eukprot:PhM_4_TR2766/c0_g1_i1/m.89228
MDETQDHFLDAFLEKSWGITKLPALKKRGDNAWKLLLDAFTIDQEDVQEVVLLRVPVVKFLAQHIKHLASVDPEKVPLSSVRRALQLWYEHTKTSASDREVLVEEVRTLRSFARASVQRASPPPRPSKPTRQLLASLEEDEEDEEEEEEPDPPSQFAPTLPSHRMPPAPRCPQAFAPQQSFAPQAMQGYGFIPPPPGPAFDP